MNAKIIIAAVLAAITRFLLSFLIYGMLLKTTFEENMMTGFGRSDEEMLFGPVIISHLIFGYFIAYVFSKWANISTFMGGIKGGITIGLLISVSMGLELFGVSNIYGDNMMMVVYDVLAITVMYSICGGVTGWWLGRGAASA